MWRFKPFMQKEQAGLEGRFVDVGNLKIHVRNAIAEGGFSCVYLARDIVHASKQYALKHIICNDEESMELAMKEISVMKSLKGHPNVVTLYAHTILDMGRTKEALLVMEFCEKSLVSVLESRGAGYFEEKQVLSIFKDVCNAIFAMHCQSPPIAHRDLKAENLLLGSDGLWKLCDFGSTSTNHKRFEKPEEMGIEEDNIRKYTTPAYRAPEMWDLFRRELINEKVDIWALGCLLFRICYFKNAFDGESKLQILNGNYRIPELPKYSSFVTDLIREMLQASPDDRPDITQVWFRVNEQLPVNLQNSLPDRPPELESASMNEAIVGISKPVNRSPPMPRRSAPHPPSSGETMRNISQSSVTSGAGGGGGKLGAFWSTQHAKDSYVAEDKSRPKLDDEATGYRASKIDRSQPEDTPLPRNTSPAKEEITRPHSMQRDAYGKSHKPEDGPTKDFELTFFQRDEDHGADKPRASKHESTTIFQDEAFNSFVAEFDTNKLSSEVSNTKSSKERALEAEVYKLKEQLTKADMEKTEITSKFEKLSAICRSQRHEIQVLKQALAARTPSPNKDASMSQSSPGIQPSATPLQEKSDWSPLSPEAKTWQAFAEDPKLQQQPINSVRTRNGHPNKQAGQATSGFDTWGFGTESFMAAPVASSQGLKPSSSEGNTSQHFGESKIMKNPPSSQPAGWAGF
ncbi:Pkinase domain-containing protein [Cephalotus follicularis]|uniref:non-specific serine/threonine protein kinase n=1 Tax=Cephalotus follicularis TaxID=3775 RepID=A0A1Q3CDG7_CEPFO|nr:Pkinase domain-containing protein [Cephalotus follicularis]